MNDKQIMQDLEAKMHKFAEELYRNAGAAHQPPGAEAPPPPADDSSTTEGSAITAAKPTKRPMAG